MPVSKRANKYKIKILGNKKALCLLIDSINFFLSIIK